MKQLIVIATMLVAGIMALLSAGCGGGSTMSSSKLTPDSGSYGLHLAAVKSDGSGLTVVNSDPSALAYSCFYGDTVTVNSVWVPAVPAADVKMSISDIVTDGKGMVRGGPSEIGASTTFQMQVGASVHQISFTATFADGSQKTAAVTVMGGIPKTWVEISRDGGNTWTTAPQINGVYQVIGASMHFRIADVDPGSVFFSFGEGMGSGVNGAYALWLTPYIPGDYDIYMHFAGYPFRVFQLHVTG